MSWNTKQALQGEPPARAGWSTLAASIACLMAGFHPAPAIADSAEACNQTTRSAAGACGAQAQANQNLALAMCDNLSAASQAAACRKVAALQFAADSKSCVQQSGSRTSACQLLGQAAYDPAIVAADFSPNITNPWMPLTPGTVMTYSVPNGLTVIEVLAQTKVLMGVTCAVIHDKVTVNGVTEEDTYDYFAQDSQGNVWYFGEQTTQFGTDGIPSGVVGSWLAGVNRAKPGIIMKAFPQIGDAYRQEFLIGVAEDAAQVIAFNQTVKVPYGTFSNAMETLEFSGLEPGSSEHKYFVPGVGNVLVVDLVTGEKNELLSVTHH